MMIRVHILLCLFISTTALSQKAVDFVMKDTDGNQWHLFEELDKGKTVLLDFFYADCVPCQTLTPQIVQIYNDYGNDTGQVLVLGISDRDNDTRLDSFGSDFGVNYPSGGIDGNGDSITLAYNSWFSFIGWPTYAVVCPNRDMSWDLDKSQGGLPEIRSAIDTCVLYNSAEERNVSNPFIFKIIRNQIEIYSNSAEMLSIQIFDVNGLLLSDIEININSNPFVHDLRELNNGLYIIRVRSKTTIQTYKFIKRQ